MNEPTKLTPSELIKQAQKYEALAKESKSWVNRGFFRDKAKEYYALARAYKTESKETA